MSKIFTLRSIFSLMVILLMTLVLVACGGENDQEIVDAALDTVVIPFTSGDTASSVTQDLVLPTSDGDISITWLSNNPEVISNTGVVTRPIKGTADVTVLLTATLGLNDLTATKTFTLIVKANLYTALDALDMITIEGTSLEDTGLVDGVHSYSATSDIILPTSILGFDVVWSTTDAETLSTAGAVVRPAYGQTNSTVTLTATVLEEELTFIVTVLSETEDPGNGLLELTLEQLAQFDGKNGNKAYIAVNGVIYDVTDSSLWPNGSHNGYQAGQDLTTFIMSSPHGLSTLSRIPIVGTLVEATS